MASKYLPLAIVALLGVGAYLLSDRCGEEECSAVSKAKKIVVDVLTSKFNVSRDKAEELAEDLFSGDEKKASKAASEIKSIGALSEVIEAVNSQI